MPADCARLLRPMAAYASHGNHRLPSAVDLSGKYSRHRPFRKRSPWLPQQHDRVLKRCGQLQPAREAACASGVRAAASSAAAAAAPQPDDSQDDAPAASKAQEQFQRHLQQVPAAGRAAYASIASKLAVVWHLLLRVTMVVPAFAAKRRLKHKQLAAAKDPVNAAMFHALLAELNRQNKSHAVIEMVDGGSYAVSDAVISEYLRALIRTDRISSFVSGGSALAGGAQQQSMADLLAQLRTKLTDPKRARPALGHTPQRPMHVQFHGGVPLTAQRGSWLRTLLSWLGALGLLAGCLLFGIAVGFRANMRMYPKTTIIRHQPPAAATPAVGLGAPPPGLYGLMTSPKEYKDEIVPEVSRKRFTDVRGCPEAKAELEEIVQYLRDPARFTRLGGQLPKGVLLTGPPGTGKTLLARAVAGEAGVPFFYRAGAEFDEMLVGVGSARVRALFAAAKAKAPCIVFVDELDAVGQSRQHWDTGSRKTLNQLLVEMDGFEPNSGVIVMGATNLESALDPALMRAGRFDRHVAVPLPDVHGRLEVLTYYLQGKPVSEDVDAALLARSTPGFSGAELANLVNEAALLAAQSDAECITAHMLDSACDKIRMGVERKSLVRLADARRRTAYHEGGHVLAALYTPGAHPVHKATIVPRGHALGYVAQVPDGDESSMTAQQVQAFIDCCMGGRVAEELLFGLEQVSTGASSDLKKATQLARHMVTQWGMSPQVGPVYVEESDMGPDMRRQVDSEVRRILSQSHSRVTHLMEARRSELDSIARALLEHETLTLTELQQVVRGDFKKAPVLAAAAATGKGPSGGGSAADAAAPAAEPDGDMPSQPRAASEQQPEGAGVSSNA